MRRLPLRRAGLGGAEPELGDQPGEHGLDLRFQPGGGQPAGDVRLVQADAQCAGELHDLLAERGVHGRLGGRQRGKPGQCGDVRSEPFHLGDHRWQRVSDRVGGGPVADAGPGEHEHRHRERDGETPAHPLVQQHPAPTTHGSTEPESSAARPGRHYPKMGYMGGAQHSAEPPARPGKVMIYRPGTAGHARTLCRVGTPVRGGSRCAAAATRRSAICPPGSLADTPRSTARPAQRRRGRRLRRHGRAGVDYGRAAAPVSVR